MRIAVLYRTNSEHERQVTDFERDFQSRTGRSVELLDVNTVEGDAMAKTYDILRYPTVLAIANDGNLLQMWQGDYMPLINEVSYYTQS